MSDNHEGGIAYVSQSLDGTTITISQGISTRVLPIPENELEEKVEGLREKGYSIVNVPYSRETQEGGYIIG